LYNKPLIFVLITGLVLALVYSPAATTFYVFAAPPASGFLNPDGCNFPSGGSGNLKSGDKVACCWREGPAQDIVKCQTCTWTEGVGYSGCSNPQTMVEGRLPGLGTLPEDGVLEVPPTPPSGPAAPLQGGVLEQQPPSQEGAAPLTRGQGVLPEEGVLQQEPTDGGTGSTPRTVEPPSEDEATQPLTEPVPPCPEGQVLNEETNLCVLEEQEATEEPTTEEEQPSEESGSEEDNDNN
jgi:hypothetical protein